MKYLFAAAASLALSTPAAAQALDPPPYWDHPFAGELIETTATTMDDMANWCAPHPRAYKLNGCAQLYGNR